MPLAATTVTVQARTRSYLKSPAADKRLWQFTGTRLTTYIGVHGTITGPG